MKDSRIMSLALQGVMAASLAGLAPAPALAANPLRWVRYYGDALLIDVRDGRIVDIVRGGLSMTGLIQGIVAMMTRVSRVLQAHGVGASRHILCAVVLGLAATMAAAGEPGTGAAGLSPDQIGVGLETTAPPESAQIIISAQSFDKAVPENKDNYFRAIIDKYSKSSQYRLELSCDFLTDTVNFHEGPGSDPQSALPVNQEGWQGGGGKNEVYKYYLIISDKSLQAIAARYPDDAKKPALFEASWKVNIFTTKSCRALLYPAEARALLAAVATRIEQGGPDFTIVGPVAMMQEDCARKQAIGCAQLGEAYLYGAPGVTVDYAHGLTFSRQACDLNSAYGCYNSAMFPAAGEDEAAGAALLTKSCTLGFGPACNELGQAFRNGQGVAQDDAAAAANFTRACDAQVAEGCYSEALAYRFGRGVAQDKEKGKALAMDACDLGDDEACHALQPPCPSCLKLF